MRKIVLSLTTALCLVGCAKEVESSLKPDENLEGMMTICAQQTETKTYLGEPESGVIPVLWEASDQLWVRSSSQATGTSGSKFTTKTEAISQGGKVAVFTGQTLPDGKMVAVFPYSLVDVSSDNNLVKVNVPKNQVYAESSFGSQANFAMAVFNTGSNAYFKNLAGSFKLSITGTKSIMKIVLSDNDPSSILWGTCDITVGESGADTLVWKNTSTDCNELTLTFGSAVTLDPTNAKPFFFVVPVGAFAKGFTCTIYDESNKAIKTVGTDKDLSVVRNKIVNMASINPTDQKFSGGQGTSENPFRIATSGDLVELSNKVNGSDASSWNTKYYRQIRNIDMNGVTIASIGKTSSTPFNGCFDGGNYTISNLAPSTASSSAAGMFGYLNGATVKNIRIDGFTNSGTTTEVGQGVIAGNAVSSTISNCSVNAQVHFQRCCTGGIVGRANAGTIDGCSFTGKVQNETTDTFDGTTACSVQGGIAGYVENGTVIKNCTVKAAVTAHGEQLGGIVGQLRKGSVDNCKVLEGSDVSGKNYYVGGITGWQRGSSNITNCSVQAVVVARQKTAGGITGWLDTGNIKNCVVGSCASVHVCRENGGGIAGRIYSGVNQNITIDGCVVYADVDALHSVGGIVGVVEPKAGVVCNLNIINCAYLGATLWTKGNYATSTNGWGMVGGIAGWLRLGTTTSNVNIINCFTDPSSIRSDDSAANKLSAGGIVADQSGTAGEVNICNCYTTLSSDRVYANGKNPVPSGYSNYGAIAATSEKITVDHVYYPNGIPMCGSYSTLNKTNYGAYTVYKMVNGTMLAKLKEYTNPSYTLKTWVGNNAGYPVFSGISVNPTQERARPLRISLIGDSLSAFFGYAPYDYGCHYPTTDNATDQKCGGGVTSALQCFWSLLAYTYMQNAIIDTNLGYSGTMVTPCTVEYYKDQDWYDQDFVTRYIKQGGLGTPDIILINGGANDWVRGNRSPVPVYLYGTKSTRSDTPPTDAQMNSVYSVADKCTTLDQAKSLPATCFVEAYVKLVKMMMLQYPNVKIVVIIHDTIDEGIEKTMIHIANHYSSQCRYVDLYAVNGHNDLGWNQEYLAKGYQPNMPKHDFDWSYTDISSYKTHGDHYSAKAMNFIANKIYTELGSWLEGDWEEDPDSGVSDYNNINGNW